MATTLASGRFKPADHYNNQWSAALQADQSLDDALKPDFWAHNAGVLKPGDLIRLLPEKGDYFAELVVIQCARAFAKVKLLRHIPFEDDATGDPLPIPDELEVAWKGPHAKHAVIRKSDSVILKDGISSKTDAEQWARDHLSAMAR